MVLADYDNVPLRRGVKQIGQHHLIAVLQGLQHGSTLDPHHAECKGKDQYDAEDGDHHGIQPVDHFPDVPRQPRRLLTLFVSRLIDRT